MTDLTIPSLLVTAVGAEAVVIKILWSQLKAERKGRIRDRDRATRIHLKLLEKHSGTNLSDSEATSQEERTG